MAKELDLQEQEQLDALKAWWKQYGNLITWVLIAALTAYAGWNGWQWYQRDQATKAGALFDELDRAGSAGDVEKATRAFNDLKARYPGTAFAEQGALVAAAVQQQKGQADAAKTTLGWLAENGAQDEMRTIARLRLSGLLLEAKQYDEALKTLDGATAPTFASLVGDRRGDVLMAQGKKDEARAAYQAAHKAMLPKSDLRPLLDAKLAALGVAPEPAASAASASAGAAK